jgi:hypothetical protein
MEQSEQIDKLATALAKAQSEVEGAKKDSANPHFKSKYADLASVWLACREALTKNGLAIIQGPGRTENGVMSMTTQLVHASGQWVRETMSIPLQKQDAQGYGSATTYARRYALAAFVGVSPEDDDGNAASHPQQRHDVAPRQNNVAPIAPTRQQPERLKGPIKTRAELRTACGDFVREIHSCGDLDQFEALIASKRALIDQVQAEHKLYWEGDGADFLGLRKEIERMRAELEQQEEHTERYRNSALAAG